MFKDIQKQLKEVLDKHRFQHTLGVAYTAASLAMCYHTDIRQAFLAGLLHDCAKCYTDEEQLRLCTKYEIPIRDVERENPFLLHAKLGAYLAREKYQVEDIHILHAIDTHTTGSTDMSLLQEIIFAADYIEPGRDKQPRLDIIRQECFTNLQLGIYHILEDTLMYLNTRRSSIDSRTLDTFDAYKAKMKKG